MKPPSETVSFRLPTDLLEELARLAEAYNERYKTAFSSKEFARKIVIDHITDTDRQELRSHLLKTNVELHTLREDIATAIKAVLINIGKADPVQVDRWVKGALFPHAED